MDKRPRYSNVDGLRVPYMTIEDMVRAAMKFRAGKEDVVVATYPKCGTTWMTQIVSMILRKGIPHTSNLEYFSTTPYIEFTDIEHIDQLPRPRCIRTHFPFNLIEYSNEAKYICVIRHPADCLVSFYHHARLIPAYDYDNGDFDQFFGLFLKGELDYNDYFDHLLSWYEQTNRSNILCVTYESMKEDLREAVLKVARHIGEEHCQGLLENEELLKKVLYYCSFDYMQKVTNQFFWEGFVDPAKELCQGNRVMIKNYNVAQEAKKKGHRFDGQFIRKGIVGDGKLNLSEEQMERLKERIRVKTEHSDVMKLWERYRQLSQKTIFELYLYLNTNRGYYIVF